jgi:hypothetical protein
MFSVNDQEKFSTNLSLIQQISQTHFKGSKHPCLVNTLRYLYRSCEQFLSKTTPCKEGALNEASFTSPALSPKIAKQFLF